ncbi:hypothetical protein ACLKA7_015207 [Drosophila subpalustris]
MPQLVARPPHPRAVPSSEWQEKEREAERESQAKALSFAAPQALRVHNNHKPSGIVASWQRGNVGGYP